MTTALSLMLSFVLAATSSPRAPFGTYRGPMGEFTLESRPDGKAHLDFSIGIPGCAGGIEGDGTLDGGVFTYTEAVEGQEEPCAITISIDRSTATVTSEHCGYFHGASCEFDGEYRRARKGS